LIISQHKEAGPLVFLSIQPKSVEREKTNGPEKIWRNRQQGIMPA
jgi:hypothetical protein